MAQLAIGGKLQCVVVNRAGRFKEFDDVHGVAILTVRRPVGKGIRNFEASALQ